MNLGFHRAHDIHCFNLLIDDESSVEDTHKIAAHELFQSTYSILLYHRVTLIAHQLEIEFLFLLELLKMGNSIWTLDSHCTKVSKLGMQIPEGAGLHRTAESS